MLRSQNPKRYAHVAATPISTATFALSKIPPEGEPALVAFNAIAILAGMAILILTPQQKPRCGLALKKRMEGIEGSG